MEGLVAVEQPEQVPQLLLVQVTRVVALLMEQIAAQVAVAALVDIQQQEVLVL
jgi:hypothetical protein